MRAFGPTIASAIATAVLATAPVEAAERISNDEYGFSVELPDGSPVCWGESGTHVHGVGTRLAGQDCAQPGPSLSLWADYNSAFLPDARHVLRYEGRCAGPKAAWARGEWRHAVGGLRTAMCHYERADGAVELVLIGQTTRTEGGWGKAEDKTPHIFHTVRLVTTKARYERDLEVFRRFVRSIRISPPR
ncbi:hypothetical protein [Phenylobacterium sp.]|jgi:hypothetical protein|uniref:hypothetical protein n=1 Tax=Phenylobacterium sp. TaxID=1871053 RepID=UPI002F936B8C